MATAVFVQPGGDFWAWGVVVEELGTSSRGQIQIQSCIKRFAMPRGWSKLFARGRRKDKLFRGGDK